MVILFCLVLRINWWQAYCMKQFNSIISQLLYCLDSQKQLLRLDSWSSLLTAWLTKTEFLLIISQCSPEVPATGFFAGYSCLKHRLLLSNKITENYSLFFCKIILSVAWICALFGSAGCFIILADYFKICGEHWYQ